ncbi:MAG TPA: alkaline phosphatase family protein [Longimicrobiales bacterium]|nr:alkaline phosphatase family protein [Longimicrobiales bacterium]
MDPSISSPGRLKRLRRALFRFYYRLKYFPFTSERKHRREREERGFVVIQVDALAYDDLIEAMRRGYAPRLKRLLERDGWDLRRYQAGLPSATPAAQAAIFFGTKDDIPAFRFYEKQDRRLIIGSRPVDVQRIRDRLPESGILDGGSSYVNIYDGGADRAIFALAAKRPQRFLAKMGGGRVGLLALLHPIRMVRMVIDSVIEYVREEFVRLWGQMRGQYTYYWWYLPFLHIGTNVVLRELQTLAVLLDIYTGVPSIYTTYNVYDEFAHHFGPGTRTSFSSVRALDRRIGEIMAMLRRAPGRPYDLYILSDHGQTPSVPYRVRYGETLGDTINNIAKHGVFVMAGTGDYSREHQDVMDFLVQELEHVSEESSLPARKAGLGLGRWLRQHYNLFPLIAETVKDSSDSKIVVTYSSSLAHVYWREPARPLSFDDVRDDPDRRGLYYFLVAHDGIGCVITRMLDGAHVESLRGRALVTPAGEIEILSGEDPLECYAQTAVERIAVAKLATMSNAGDLILFGAYDPEQDICVCFDDQVGAHGAMGGRQSWPFIMTPRGLVPEDYEINDPIDLHPLFRRYTVEPEDPRLRRPGVERRTSVTS